MPTQVSLKEQIWQVPRCPGTQPHAGAADMQGTREVEGLVFTMVSDLGKLKRKVDLLGSAKDTLSHRCVWQGLACLHPRGWAPAGTHANAPSSGLSNRWPGGVGAVPVVRCFQLMGYCLLGRAHAYMDTYRSVHAPLPHLTRSPMFPCYSALLLCTLSTAPSHEQGGACQPEPQHTVHSQSHQDTAGGPQQGAGLTARAAAGKVAKADAGLCSSTAGMRSCSNQPPASTTLQAADCSNKAGRIAQVGLALH